MQPVDFEEALEKILAHDNRYHREAYFFLREALDYAQKKFAKSKEQQVRHVSGQELLEGIREFGLLQYGPMTFTLLQEWGVNRGEDFGELVFNMVDHGLLSKTDKDSREDFKGGYDFSKAFLLPFVPASKQIPPVTEREMLPSKENPDGAR
jgi:uncharacterized repeat protein (TIGR04138 family)